MAVSVRLSPKDEELFKSYAKINHISLSELFRNAVFEKIEDEYDLKTYREALDEYRQNPISYSQEEVYKILGIE